MAGKRNSEIAKLVKANDPVSIHKLQGRIEILDEVMKLREKFNAKDGKNVWLKSN